jgi:hypothetical protein
MFSADGGPVFPSQYIPPENIGMPPTLEDLQQGIDATREWLAVAATSGNMADVRDATALLDSTRRTYRLTAQHVGLLTLDHLIK